MCLSGQSRCDAFRTGLARVIELPPGAQQQAVWISAVRWCARALRCGGRNIGASTAARAGEALLIKKLTQRALHRLVDWGQRGRRLVWFVTNPSTRGVHAVPVTPGGRIVLVTLSYARGWRVPGGGLKAGEDAEAGILRELREEIGLSSNGAVEKVMTFTQHADFKNDCSSLFVVRDVIYSLRWSLEIRAVREFSLDNLPRDLPQITRGLLRAAADVI